MNKIFVINLPSSVDRRDNISQQLDQLKLPFEIFPAVDGRKGNHPLFEKYDEGLSKLYRGKTLSAGQLGCYASHYLLWEKCLELNEPILVIEDDTLLYPTQFMAFLEQLPTLGSEFECIRLFSNKRRSFRSSPVKNIGELAIAKFSKGHMSTTGYYLTPAAAKKLIQHSSRWYMAVDIYMDRFWVNQVECYGTIPACLTNDPKFDSEIGYGKKASRSLYTRCKREWFNLNELLKREFHNLRFKIKNTKK